MEAPSVAATAARAVAVWVTAGALCGPAAAGTAFTGGRGAGAVASTDTLARGRLAFSLWLQGADAAPDGVLWAGPMSVTLGLGQRLELAVHGAAATGEGKSLPGSDGGSVGLRGRLRLRDEQRLQPAVGIQASAARIGGRWRPELNLLLSKALPEVTVLLDLGVAGLFEEAGRFDPVLGAGAAVLTTLGRASAGAWATSQWSGGTVSWEAGPVLGWEASGGLRVDLGVTAGRIGGATIVRAFAGLTVFTGPSERERDRDRDGVVDLVDRCWWSAEVENGFEDDDGCPDEVPTVAEAPEEPAFTTTHPRLRLRIRPRPLPGDQDVSSDAASPATPAREVSAGDGGAAGQSGAAGPSGGAAVPPAEAGP